MKKKNIILTGTGIISVLAGGSMLAANKMMESTFVRSKKTKSEEEVDAGIIACLNERQILNREFMQQEYKAWLPSIPHEIISTYSIDALTLKAEAFYADADQHTWIIVAHGYSGNRSNMHSVAMRFVKQGYHVLTPDNRAHGESGGTFIGMGWLDRMDIIQWIKYIIDMDADAKIVLYGISMGASAVMMCSGEELPDNVIGCIEDCGFTSVYDIVKYQMKQQYQLPLHPFIEIANSLIKSRGGYDIKKASSLLQIRKAKLPMLFIHGELDDFVPVSMVFELYNAYPARKDLYIVEGSNHGFNYYSAPEEYFHRIFLFLKSIHA